MVVFKSETIFLFYSPDAGSNKGWEKPACLSTELQRSEAAMLFLGAGFFSGELLSLSCWSAPLILWGGGEKSLKLGRPDCPFLKLGEVLAKPGEAEELLELFCDVSEEGLIVLAACGFSSPVFTPLSARVLPEELQVLEAGEAELSHATILSAEDRSEPTDLLAELKDVRGRGIELLFESLVWHGDNAFERDTAEELVCNVVPSFLSFSSVFVDVGFCWLFLRWAKLSCSSGDSAWWFIWELLKLWAQPVRSKVVCATEASLLPETSVFLRYFSMSNVLSSPAQVLLWSASSKALW